MDVQLQLDYVLRIAIACICGMMIGYERKSRNKEAGIRTHAIVALGAALIMIVSKYGFDDIAEYDASRAAAQIVSGIGFLGAGIIFVKKQMVSGLTTAAGIWATSGVGMALGAGMYLLGVIISVMLILVQIITHVSKNNSMVVRHELELEIDDYRLIDEIQHILHQHKIKIDQIIIEKKEQILLVQFAVINLHFCDFTDLIDDFLTVKGINKVNI